MLLQVNGSVNGIEFILSDVEIDIGKYSNTVTRQSLVVAIGLDVGIVVYRRQKLVCLSLSIL